MDPREQMGHYHAIVVNNHVRRVVRFSIKAFSYYGPRIRTLIVVSDLQVRH